jgi:uncharacterized small protein (DUF1192 family)
MNDDAKALRVELAYARAKIISNEILYDQIAILEQENSRLKVELAKMKGKKNVEKPATDTGMVQGA